VGKPFIFKIIINRSYLTYYNRLSSSEPTATKQAEEEAAVKAAAEAKKKAEEEAAAKAAAEAKKKAEEEAAAKAAAEAKKKAEEEAAVKAAQVVEMSQRSLLAARLERE
jgi:colicin import membrane protein